MGKSVPPAGHFQVVNRLTAKAPVSLTWKMGAVEVQPGYYENSFVLKNISDVPLEKDWIIYYSQLPREILQEESGSGQSGSGECETSSGCIRQKIFNHWLREIR